MHAIYIDHYFIAACLLQLDRVLLVCNYLSRNYDINYILSLLTLWCQSCPRIWLCPEKELALFPSV